ncbi:MAG: cyanophycinase [Bacteroidetes bacterium]|nr:cyanophycinase [Bacteroidota bacterium]
MSQKIPKGTLILIGGAEDKGDGSSNQKNREYERFEILSELLPKKDSHKKKRLEIITTASRVPVEVNEMYRDAFKKIGFKEVGFINMINNPEADDPKLVKRINDAHAVLFSGGDQFRLATILGSSDVIDAIKEKYFNDPEFIVAGTSAGAMAMSVLMLYEGENNEAMLSQTVKFSSGLGFIEGCIIDTHFIKRGRFGRLAQSIIMNPACIGIGLGEDTALVIKKGNEAECKGSGMVIIIDGKDVGHTNIAYARQYAPLCIENLRVHILSKGNGYTLRERRFVPSKSDLQEEQETKGTTTPTKLLQPKKRPASKKQVSKKTAEKKSAAKKTIKKAVKKKAGAGR